MRKAFLAFLLGLVSAIGLSAQAPAPVAPQEAPAPAVSFHVKVIVGSENPVGNAVQAAIDKQVANPPAGVTLTAGASEKDEPSQVNLRVLLGSNSPSSTGLSVIILYHRKGFEYPIYLASHVGEITAADVDESVNEVLEAAYDIAASVAQQGDKDLVSIPQDAPVTRARAVAVKFVNR